MRVVGGILMEQFSRAFATLVEGCWEFVEEITPTPL